MTDAAAFCKACGGAIAPGDAFCMRCGTPVEGDPRGTRASSRLGAAYGAVTGVVERARTVGGAVGALPGGLATLPWQTITVGQAPDIRSLVAEGAPLARQAVHASLRKPAVALLFTTLLDVVVALASAQPGALKMVAIRAIMGLGTSLLGMIVGSKAGPLRTVTGAASAVTGLVQASSVLVTAVAAATTPPSLVALVPSVISQLSSLVMLVKTTVVSLRK